MQLFRAISNLFFFPVGESSSTNAMPRQKKTDEKFLLDQKLWRGMHVIVMPAVNIVAKTHSR
jgi:hypothetical protein